MGKKHNRTGFIAPLALAIALAIGATGVAVTEHSVEDAGAKPFYCVLFPGAFGC